MNDHQEISVMQYHNIIAARVLDRHDLTQDQLAREAQIDPSHLSRMLRGERTLSPEVLRALLKLTRDPELLAAITGEPGIIYLYNAEGDGDPGELKANCVVSLAYMLNQCHTPISSDDDRMRRVADIDQTMSALASMRSSLLSSPLPSTQQPRERRTVKHPPNVIDQVA
jgi:transcriptional regulator with XRE-family HTH domain